MFVLWLDRSDATWGNLIRLLVDAEQKDLAEQVKDALSLQSMKLQTFLTFLALLTSFYCQYLLLLLHASILLLMFLSQFPVYELNFIIFLFNCCQYVLFISFMLSLLKYVLYQFLVYESGLYNKVCIIFSCLKKQFTLDPHSFQLSCSNAWVGPLHNLQCSLEPRSLSEEERAGLQLLSAFPNMCS